MKYFTIPFILLIFTLPGWACECPAKLSMAEALSKADSCFVGRVEGIRKSPIKEGYNEVTMVILDRYKGLEEVKGTEIIIFTKISTDQCGVGFFNGQDYVVFASGPPAGLKTDSCAGTGVLELMMSNLDEIKRLVGRPITAPKTATPKPTPISRQPSGLKSDMYFKRGPS